jgi:predicted phosphoribosyltransferase
MRQPEFAMGAIASGGVRVLDPKSIDHLRISAIEDTVRAEERELARREREYRVGRPPAARRE